MNQNNDNLQELLEEINYSMNASMTHNNYYNNFQLYTHFNSSEPIQRVMTESLYDRNPIKYVITEDVKNSLIPIKFKHAIDKENNEKCSITVEIFKDDDEIIQLPCNHCFFVEPIMKWLTEDSCECPVCRYKFERIEKKVVETEEVEEVEEVVVEEVEEEIEEASTFDDHYDNYYINSNHSMMFSNIIHSIFSEFYNGSNNNTYYSVEHPTPPLSDFD
jgi:hypothetical protein